jgi:hypothetical protein
MSSQVPREGARSHGQREHVACRGTGGGGRRQRNFAGNRR